MARLTAPTRTRIPVAEPDLSGREAEYVADAIASSWISSTGPYVERFEREYAAWVGSRAALSVANGTVALHLALLAHGVGPGDEVIIPSLTYIATANAVRYTGAEPVFVDVDPATWCIDPGAIEPAITSRTRGIIPVDVYGHPADMDAINAVAAKHGLWVVEDAAEAHGATYKGRQAGTLASISTWSFYGNKVLTSGEGGALTTDDPELEARMRLFRGQGMDPKRRYFFTVVGYNYRLTNVACAMLCAQLERVEEIVPRRRSVFTRYRAALTGIPGIGFQPQAAWAVPAPWLFCMTVDEAAYGRSRDELMAILATEGVETRPFFIPIHRLPPYVDSPGSRRDLPHTDRIGGMGMNLPTSNFLPDVEIAWIADVIRRNAR
jgi:perosamine synthetase